MRETVLYGAVLHGEKAKKKKKQTKIYGRILSLVCGVLSGFGTLLRWRSVCFAQILKVRIPRTPFHSLGRGGELRLAVLPKPRFAEHIVQGTVLSP